MILHMLISDFLIDGFGGILEDRECFCKLEQKVLTVAKDKIHVNIKVRFFQE